MENQGMPAWMVDGFLELNALVRVGHSANLADGVQQITGRAPAHVARVGRQPAASELFATMTS